MSDEIVLLFFQESGHRESGGRPRVSRTPWRKIVTSPPVWALTAGHVASNWWNYQLNSMMPTYLNDVLK